MGGGETLYLIGVIAAFVAFSTMLAYAQIPSGRPKREPANAARA